MRNLNEAQSGCQELLGNSTAIRNLCALIAKVAPARSTVLIEGESGTGKELVARAIHAKSKRDAGPFLAINCGALPENLLESELFGYERGAFTGAVTSRRGDFELAEGGTLFLDEIAELTQAMQAKLLRALQQREIRRVGGERAIPVNIRVVAATSRSLHGSEFRPELYYRLNVVSLKTPALRDRREDIPLLVQHFIATYSKSMEREVLEPSAEAAAALMQYHWPGNVRQLENAVERAIVLGSSNRIQRCDLPEELFALPANEPTYEEALRACKRDIIRRSLARTNGDYRQAAVLLGLFPTSLLRLIRTLGMKS